MAGIRQAYDGAIVQGMLSEPRRRRLKRQSATSRAVARELDSLKFKVPSAAPIRTKCQVQRGALGLCLEQVAREAALGHPVADFPYQAVLGAGVRTPPAPLSGGAQPPPLQSHRTSPRFDLGGVQPVTIALSICGSILTIIATLMVARRVW